MDTEKLLSLETSIDDGFKENARQRCNSGTIEVMQERIDELEKALSHVIAFVALNLRLTEDEIEGAAGIRDF